NPTCNTDSDCASNGSIPCITLNGMKYCQSCPTNLGLMTGKPFSISGTSLSSPLWAGFTALMNQSRADRGLPPVGFANPYLYFVGKNQYTLGTQAGFNDVRASGSQNACCFGYSAEIGYDLATGLGSPQCGLIQQTTPLLSSGENYACASLSGQVKCWGANDTAQLGSGSTVPTPVYTPVAVAGVSNVTALAAGFDDHVCVLESVSGGSSVACWGLDVNGELGIGSMSSTPKPPTVLPALKNGHTLAITDDCALQSDGTVQCWGGNFFGELGDGTTSNRAAPVKVANLTGATAIAAGSGHNCAVVFSGSQVECWGGNSFGQLGNGNTTDQHKPVLVSGLSGVASLVGGATSTCALLNDGTVWCWGNNGAGQLGNGSNTSSSLPVQVQGLTGVRALAYNQTGAHNCAVTSTGGVVCWGDNEFGQLGDGTMSSNPLPTPVVGLPKQAVALSVEEWDTCAVLTDGTIWCWGDNAYGELGSGSSSPIQSSQPVQVQF
ncbi:MAG TPA: hypothetical protein VI456_07475, partial [Polyangia bacterium]